MQIGIVGLGLIGGSIAKAIKKFTPHTVLGFDTDSEVLYKAKLLDAVDGELTPERLPIYKGDANIDHRRVPNLATWFKRQGYALPVSQDATQYRPGDIVMWLLGDKLPHIGIVSDRRSDDGARPLMIHNIGWGAREDDVLFEYRMTGHFRAF